MRKQDIVWIIVGILAIIVLTIILGFMIKLIYKIVTF